jgi:hypothetical protein
MVLIDEIHYLLCQFNFNNKCQNTNKEKGLILYDSANGISTLKKHVYANHFMIANIFKEKATNLLKILYERQFTKK